MRLMRHLDTRDMRPAYARGSLWNMLTDVDDFFDRAMSVSDTGDELQDGADEKSLEAQWSFTPRANIEESKDSYHLSFDLPGVKKEDLKIDVNGRTLSVSGERRHERLDEKEVTGYRRFECVTGSFSRSFTLPEGVDAARVEAKLTDGILKLSLPKSEERKPRSIEVK